MSEEEKKLVKCVNCGNVWETKAKRPQCSICKSTRVDFVDSALINVDSNVDQNVDSNVESTESVDNLFELEDVDVEKLLNEDEEESKQEEKKVSKGKKALKKIASKIHMGILLAGLAILFVLVLLRGIINRKNRHTIEIAEDENVPSGNDPYSALG